MKQIKTRELSGKALDYCVAKLECIDYTNAMHAFKHGYRLKAYAPSSNWSQGGPIIEREGFSISKGNKGWSVANPWECIIMFGSTPLEAAMRCYVASKLGDVVSVPDELV